MLSLTSGVGGRAHQESPQNHPHPHIKINKGTSIQGLVQYHFGLTITSCQQIQQHCQKTI